MSHELVLIKALCLRDVAAAARNFPDPPELLLLEDQLGDKLPSGNQTLQWKMDENGPKNQ